MVNTGGPPDVYHDNLFQFETNCVAFASFTVLIWDHIDTFVDEVEYIWKGDKKLIVYLFLLNRYLTPLGFCVNLFAYLSPTWTVERCQHFIRYEGSMTIIGIEVVALMMLIRIRGLYYHQPWVVISVGSILVALTCINAYLMTKGIAVPHRPESGVKACTMIFEPSISGLASSSAWLPLLYDTIVMLLTLYKTYPPIRKRESSYIAQRLFEDGLMYYSVIFSITLVLTIMIAVAPDGLKNITAQLELLLTVTMMSRITLNLRKSVRKRKESRLQQSYWMKSFGTSWDKSTGDQNPPHSPIHALEAHSRDHHYSPTSFSVGHPEPGQPKPGYGTVIDMVIDRPTYSPHPNQEPV